MLKNDRSHKRIAFGSYFKIEKYNNQRQGDLKTEVIEQEIIAYNRKIN